MDVGTAIFNVLTRGPSNTRKKRIAVLRHYSQVAEKLDAEKTKLHKSLNPGVAVVIKERRILLF